MTSEPHEFQYDFTLDWMINRTATNLSVFERTPNGVGVGKAIASFGAEHDASIRRLIEHHNGVVQMLVAHIDELQNGPRQGWMFVCEDHFEWSSEHPIESGSYPQAQQVKPATQLAFWNGGE